MSGNNTFTIAYKYHTLGRCVIPSGGGRDGKSALVKWEAYQNTVPTDEEIDRWNVELKPTMWAMVTGKVSGVFVIDADTPEAVELMHNAGLKPHVRTRKGEHYYCKYPGFPIGNKVRLIDGIDIRGDGGYVNFCGDNYKVDIMPEDDTLYEIHQLPQELATAILASGKSTRRSKAGPVPDKIPHGQRNATLTSMAGTMRRRRMNREAILAALIVANADQCEPPLPRHEVEGIVDSVCRYEPVLSQFNLTELGNAERLVAQHGENLRYCWERSRWLVWGGKAWEWDMGAKTTALAKLAVRNIYHEAGDEPDEKRRKGFADHAKQSESDHRIGAMLSLARSELGIPIKVTELDTDPWLFNCLNGTIDLRTGQLLPHRKETLVTIIAPVEYRPDAPCPCWLSFLDRVTSGDTELAGYLQRAVGYSLTGDTKSQVLFFLYGLGNNGKSTFVTTIRKLTGEYGERVNTDLFMLKDRNFGGPKEALANLKGKRYVVASELEDGRRLAVTLIKDMTGGETIKADRKYEHEIEYQPTHKLWLVGNHKPTITDTTLSIWRRVKLIPFTVTIPDKEIDPDLPSKLEAELPGILTWAVKGCLDWQRYGLKEPDTVTTATASYRHEQDILGDFIEGCCILEPLASIPKADLKDEYHRWCQDNSVDPVTQRTFKARLIEKGIGEKVSSDGKKRLWHGIRLGNDNNTSDISDKTNGTPKLSDKISQNFPESPLAKGNTKKFIENSVKSCQIVRNDDIPDYPAQPCHNCGCGDYWLTDDNRWLCSRCHPKPGSKDNA